MKKQKKQKNQRFCMYSYRTMIGWESECCYTFVWLSNFAPNINTIISLRFRTKKPRNNYMKG